MSPRRRVGALALFAVLLTVVATAPVGSFRVSAQVQVTRETVATGLEWPVSFAFAPDGRIFYNERLTGRIRAFVEGSTTRQTIGSVPVSTNGEQGLLGLALDPDFTVSPWAYVYHTYFNATLGGVANRVMRLPVGPTILFPEVLLDPIPASTIHNGGILGFAPDGTLFITTGDAANSANSQDNGSLAGKVLRINRDGTIPANNPTPDSRVYSLGHRNMFGLTFQPATGRPYVSENGPSSNDEINLVEAGRNCGWPIVTGDANDPRFVDPILTFANVIAPTGLAYYTGYVASWQNSLFLGDWNRGVLQRVELSPPDYRQVLRSETIDTVGPNGILDVEMGRDGYVYYSTPNAIYRLWTPPPPSVDAVPGSYFVPMAVAIVILAVVVIVIVWRYGHRGPPRP